jgi:hypothetical protein
MMSQASSPPTILSASRSKTCSGGIAFQIPTGNEVVQLVIANDAVACRHGLDTFAVTGTDQPRHIGAAHRR